MKSIRLNTGIEIPIVGSGTNTFGKENHGYTAAINGETKELESAVKLGYRHFDTAIMYRNEAVVAAGLKKSGLSRKDFFITSKLPEYPDYVKDSDAVKSGVAFSLKALDTDYIDLYLIHHPWENLEGVLIVWQTLEEFVDKGVIKAIGVSNFMEHELNYLLEHGRIRPAVNQVESHPGLWNHEIIDFCQEHGVVPEAWGPLTRVSDVDRKELQKIGDGYGKSWAQVILNYQVNRGVVVIPKSHEPKRQAENLDIFDFNLTVAEQEKIASL